MEKEEDHLREKLVERDNSSSSSSSSNEGGRTDDDNEFTRGEKQPPKCRDPIFALLFYLQLIAILVCAIQYGPLAFDSAYSGGTSSHTDNASGYMKIAGVTGFFAFVLAGLMLFVLMAIGNFLIKVALLFQVIMSGVIAVLAFMGGQILAGCFGIILFLLGVCYAYAVWSRIPFATANLNTSLAAVKSNFGVVGVAYMFGALSIGWFLLWSVAFVGIWASETCDTVTKICAGTPNGGILFGLFLCFFFTTQVLQNCVHVTVAGTVGTWWFAPDEVGCCSKAVWGSTFRSVTTSFGSICFGSLLVAIIQALRQLAYSLRDSDNACLICLIDCILGCIEGLIRYFNKWAYIYVGVYGYPYLEAGKNVMTLFANRGWDAIIADNLVSNVLFLVSLVVGLITGGVGVGLLKWTDWFPQEVSGDVTAVGVAFGFGFVVGLALTSILMSVVGSGVNTVIVCFAEGPMEFQRNYPELSSEMRSTWQDAFPGCLG